MSLSPQHKSLNKPDLPPLRLHFITSCQSPSHPLPSMLRYHKITFGSPLLRPFVSGSGRPLLLSSATTTRHPSRALYSTQGYGDGKGDPAGEDPVKQGVSQRTRELEHPGPEQAKKKSSTNSDQQQGSPDTSKKSSERSSNVPPRSAKEELENERATGKGQ
jgi:hypothetical protein